MLNERRWAAWMVSSRGEIQIAIHILAHLHADLNFGLFSSEKYSDLTIKYHGRKWKVHRAIVCLQSKPLAAAVDGSFKAS